MDVPPSAVNTKKNRGRKRKRLRHRRLRRRLLAFDVLVDVVAFWRLASVFRMTLAVASRQLGRACSFNPGYRWAKRRRVVEGTLVFDEQGAQLRTPSDPSPACFSEYSLKKLPALPREVPPVPTQWLAGFQGIDVWWEGCERTLGEALVSFARRIAPLLTASRHHLAFFPCWFYSAATVDSLCSRLLPVLNDGGFRPPVVHFSAPVNEPALRLLRQPLVRRCPTLRLAFPSPGNALPLNALPLASGAVAEWLLLFCCSNDGNDGHTTQPLEGDEQRQVVQQPSLEETAATAASSSSSSSRDGAQERQTVGLMVERLVLCESRLSAVQQAQFLELLVGQHLIPSFLSARSPADARPFAVVCCPGGREGLAYRIQTDAPFRRENPGSDEVLLWEPLCRAHFSAADAGEEEEAQLDAAMSSVILASTCTHCEFLRVRLGMWGGEATARLLRQPPVDGWTKEGTASPPLSQEQLEEHRPWLLRRFSRNLPLESEGLCYARVAEVELGDRVHGDNWRADQQPPAPHPAFGGRPRVHRLTLC